MSQYYFGPLQKLMDDSAVSEIMVNGPKKVFAERAGKKFLTDVTFKDDKDLSQFIEKFLEPTGKRMEKEIPYLDACLEDGSRINIILPPVSRVGISVTIRKFSKDIKTLEDLVALGTFPQNVSDFLVACVKGKLNILFSGGTATGKTTTLQMLSKYFSPHERVVTIEDTAELKMEQENVVAMETRRRDIDGRGEVSIRDLIRNALRMSPDRIVIGEVRGVEVVDMVQAMATGHKGTIAVVHGNSPRDVISRMETMMLMSGYDLPHSEIRKLLGTTINLIVHQEKKMDGARRVTYVTELRGVEKNEILFNDLFSYQNIGVDADGQPIARLKSCLRDYPLFYRRFQAQGLLKGNVFQDD